MAESRPSTEETATATHKHKGFSRKKSSTNLYDNIDEKGGNIITRTEVKPVPDESPVSFTQLFRSVEFLGAFVDTGFNAYIWTRYSTKFELFIDAIGLVAAAAAGSAQVCINFPA